METRQGPLLYSSGRQVYARGVPVCITSECCGEQSTHACHASTGHNSWRIGRCTRSHTKHGRDSLDFLARPGTFTVTFTSRMMKMIENVRIEWYLGEDANGAQCTLSGAGSGVGSAGGAEGWWAFDMQKKVRAMLSIVSQR